MDSHLERSDWGASAGNPEAGFAPSQFGRKCRRASLGGWYQTQSDGGLFSCGIQIPIEVAAKATQQCGSLRWVFEPVELESRG